MPCANEIHDLDLVARRVDSEPDGIERDQEGSACEYDHHGKADLFGCLNDVREMSDCSLILRIVDLVYRGADAVAAALLCG